MINNIKGIVIQIKDYKDNDQLLEVLTREYGIISLIAKGTKKNGAKLHYLINSMYDFSFDYKDGKNIFSIINSNLLKSYIKYDDSLMNAYVSIFYEIIEKSKDFANQEMFDNLEFLLNNISYDNYYLLGSIFMSYFMKLHGIIPYVDGCVVCNKSKVVSINNDLGGFVCEEHNNEHQSISAATLKTFRILCKANYTNYEVLKDYSVDKKTFDIFIHFFVYNSDIKLKTYDFFSKVI